MKAKKTVQCLSIFNARGFCHPSAGLSCWCSQTDFTVRVKNVIRLDYGFQDRTFTGAGAACNYRQIMLEGHHHTFILPLGQ